MEAEDGAHAQAADDYRVALLADFDERLAGRQVPVLPAARVVVAVAGELGSVNRVAGAGEAHGDEAHLGRGAAQAVQEKNADLATGDAEALVLRGVGLSGGGHGVSPVFDGDKLRFTGAGRCSARDSLRCGERFFAAGAYGIENAKLIRHEKGAAGLRQAPFLRSLCVGRRRYSAASIGVILACASQIRRRMTSTREGTLGCARRRLSSCFKVSTSMPTLTMCSTAIAPGIAD